MDPCKISWDNLTGFSASYAGRPWKSHLSTRERKLIQKTKDPIPLFLRIYRVRVSRDKTHYRYLNAIEFSWLGLRPLGHLLKWRATVVSFPTLISKWCPWDLVKSLLLLPC